MLCEKCGSMIADNSRICSCCGTPIRGEEKNITTNTTYQGSLGNPTPVLVWGILGLAFALSFYLSILGIIFSGVGLSKSKKYYCFAGYSDSGKARIGRRLSIAGMIIGIIMTTILLIVVIVICNFYSVA